MTRKKRRFLKILPLCSVFLLFLTGCIQKMQTEGEKILVTYTEVKKEKIPKELKEVIEEQKTSPFRITYTDRGKLYIAEGYGTKPQTGYSIEVKQFYEMGEVVHIKTDLKGPEKGVKIKEKDTYPYIVVETKDMGKKVIFE